MKFFPTNQYSIDIVEGRETNVEILRENTEISDKLAGKLTDKHFIGTISDTEFELINSLVGVGTFTVFKGIIREQKVDVTTQINKPFRVLILAIIFLAILAVALSFIKNGYDKSIILVLPLIALILFLRFVLIAIFNRVSSRLMLEKLKFNLR